MPQHQPALTTLKREYDELYARAGELARALEATRRQRDAKRVDLLAVIQAERRDGATWDSLGAAMGVTGQAAAQFFRRASASG